MILNKIIRDWLEKISRKRESYKLEKIIEEIYQKTPSVGAYEKRFIIEVTQRRPRDMPFYSEINS